MQNPFAQSPNPILLTLMDDAETVATLELLFEDLASSTARTLHTTQARFTAVFDSEVMPEVEERLARFEAQNKSLNVHFQPLEDTDWATQAARDFPPMRIGRFFVRGSHCDDATPASMIPLIIDASAAFGTGEHETTEGCLRVLQWLQKQRRYTRLLDMGCGTAILALGMAHLWRKPVLAIDNDPVAVRVARLQMRQNGAANRVRADVGNGYKHRIVHTRAPYDLIVANILARPLMKMARDAKRHLAPGGTLVLSGLLNDQESMVLTAHRMQGLYLHARLRLGKWSVLVLK
jgi:ribosomal protein L11 methyltransferase